MNARIFSTAFLTTALAALSLHSQELPIAVSKFADFDLSGWVHDARRVSVKPSQHFSGRPEMIHSGFSPGMCAYLKNLEFTDGTIECNMAGGSYLGISFRVIESAPQGPASAGGSGARKSEDIYFRVETNERAGTVQYYPHGKLKQEELHRPPYEESIRLIKQKEWFQVRIEVDGKRAQVFLDGNEKPVLTIDELKHEHRSGSIGLRSWGGTFANLTIVPR